VSLQHNRIAPASHFWEERWSEYATPEVCVVHIVGKDDVVGGTSINGVEKVGGGLAGQMWCLRKKSTSANMLRHYGGRQILPGKTFAVKYIDNQITLTIAYNLKFRWWQGLTGQRACTDLKMLPSASCSSSWLPVLPINGTCHNTEQVILPATILSYHS